MISQRSISKIEQSFPLGFLYGNRSTRSYRCRNAKKIRFECAFVKVKKLKEDFTKLLLFQLQIILVRFPILESPVFFLREVEKQIIEAPEYYFWTHKDGNTRNSVQLRCLIIN
jgi:hypothetical protein